jgi:hypothetical protein
VVDGAVNGLATAVRTVGATVRWIQTGVVQHYLFIVIVAVVLLSVASAR